LLTPTPSNDQPSPRSTSRLPGFPVPGCGIADFLIEDERRPTGRCEVCRVPIAEARSGPFGVWACEPCQRELRRLIPLVSRFDFDHPDRP
jgi:hypothetical protein